MKALAIRRYKAPMEIMELPRPEPGPGDLLVRVRAASVNPLDYKIRSGGVKVLIPYSFPLILGNDLAGDVEAVGAGVTKFNVGDAVYSRLDKDGRSTGGTDDACCSRSTPSEDQIRSATVCLAAFLGAGVVAQ